MLKTTSLSLTILFTYSICQYRPATPPRPPSAFGTMIDDSPSLFEAHPAYPGNPRRNIEGESPHLLRRHTV